MAITGVHTLLYTREAAAVRSLLGQMLGFGHVDDGQGWLIFKLPPAEMGIHPGDNASHEISFMCDDLNATIAELKTKRVGFRGDPVDEGWGVAIPMVLPGGVGCCCTSRATTRRSDHGRRCEHGQPRSSRDSTTDPRQDLRFSNNEATNLDRNQLHHHRPEGARSSGHPARRLTDIDTGSWSWELAAAPER